MIYLDFDSDLIISTLAIRDIIFDASMFYISLAAKEFFNLTENLDERHFDKGRGSETLSNLLTIQNDCQMSDEPNSVSFMD